jgi:hypothetical protein
MVALAAEGSRATGGSGGTSGGGKGGNLAADGNNASTYGGGGGGGGLMEAPLRRWIGEQGVVFFVLYNHCTALYFCINNILSHTHFFVDMPRRFFGTEHLGRHNFRRRSVIKYII